MLQEVSRIRAASTADNITIGSPADIMTSLMRIVRRQWPLMAVVMATVGLIAIAYLVTTTPSYTAMATMVIDSKKTKMFQPAASPSDLPTDAATVLTEIEILKSDNVAFKVVKALDLAHDPELVPTRPGLLGTLKGFFLPKIPVSESQRLTIALGSFESRETVNRVGLTYAMNIGFRSSDPDKASRIVDAIADAYITEQLESKYQATRRAGLWLQDRIKELRVQATAADKAVVDFRQANNINAVDPTGKLINEQQMSEMNSQLIMAHAATAEAKARLDRIAEVMTNPLAEGSITDALKSEIIIKLRSQYLDLSSREEISAQKYGIDHPATVNLRDQMQGLRNNIDNEMQKIAESYKSDLNIATARENAIKQSLSATVSESNVANQAQIQLRDLEGSSQSYRSMYNNFLQRYTEVIQQESFPISDARLISPATASGPRSPNTPLVIVAALMGGMMMSFGAAVVREFSDRVFRSSKQVEEGLRLPCLAVLPDIGPRRKVPEGANPGRPPRAILMTDSLLRYALDQPFSQFTEGLRSLKVAVDLAGTSGGCNVLGITSTVPSEGKSLLAINFARMAAHAGNRVLLIDGDLRNPSLTRMLTSGSAVGLLEVLAGTKSFEEVVWNCPASGLYCLPVGGYRQLRHTNEVLGSEKVKKFIASLREQFDYIVVDLAPLAPLVDTRTTSEFVDSYAYVIEWGKTKTDIIEHCLSGAPEVYQRIVGVMLNKVNLSLLGRYETHRGHHYSDNAYIRRSHDSD